MIENQIIERKLTIPTMNKLAVISLVSSLFGCLIPFVPQLIPFVPLCGIICGHIARSDIRRSGGAQTGSGIALAGLIISYLTITFFLVPLLGIGLLIILSSTTSSFFDNFFSKFFFSDVSINMVYGHLKKKY